MTDVPVPDHVLGLLAEFAEAQARPITDPALAERMKTEATTWINAVHMQHRRISKPLRDPSDPGAEAWRQEIDLHFLLVALTRLRRAVGLATRVGQLRQALIDRIAEFDDLSRTCHGSATSPSISTTTPSERGATVR